MTNSQKQYSQVQVSAWLKGLLSVAFVDNDFSDRERDLIHELSLSEQLQGEINLINMKASLEDNFQIIDPAELADALGSDPDLAQNFLRTAVLVAMADGDYSVVEDDLIRQFGTALKQEMPPISAIKHKLESLPHHEHKALLDPLKDWLDRLEIDDRRIARFLCKAIPSQCPFERDIFLFGRKVMHIPAMCQINPYYDQLVGLRFRSLSFLADKCGEDVSEFC